MKTNLVQSIIHVLITVVLIAPINTYCQSQEKCAIKYLVTLPSDLKLEERTPQKYILTSNGFDYDLIGNFIKKSRISGEYTRALENGNVIWNNVRISESTNLNEPFSEGEKQEVMENFTYSPFFSQDMFKSDSMFSKIPEPNIKFRNMVWSMMGFEIYAWSFFDSLKLNKEFTPKIKNNEVQIAGIGTINLLDLNIIWLGVTSMNNKICAIVKFSALNNPLNFNYLETKIIGRSHSWGNVYISLVDKQIEYAESYIDVVMEVKTKGQEHNYKLNTNGHTTLKRMH